MDRQKSMSDIMKNLYLFSNFVKGNSKLNINDINTKAENFYRDLLNLLFEYELKNEIFKTQNSKAVDLIDDINGIAVKVTLGNSIEKISEIVTKFMEEKLYENYDLKIVVIGNKRTLKLNKVKRSNYTFHMRNNILDNHFFNNVIMNKSNSELESILELIDRELSGIIGDLNKEE